jgi:hypothetical protein
MTRVAASGLSWAMKCQMPHSSPSTQGSRMHLGIRTVFFYPFAKSAKYFLAINAFAAIKAIDALQQLRFQFPKCFRRLEQTCGLVFLKTAKTGADDFAGSLIKPALDLFFHKFCQFRRQRYIHNDFSTKTN